MALSNWLMKKISDYLTREKQKSPSYLCDFDRICQEVRPADILLVEGKNRISKIIQRITHSPWSHAILHIGRLHNIDDPQLREEIHKNYQGKLNEQLIIESMIGKGTIICSISEYKSEHMRICRPAGLSYQDAQKVIASVTKSVGKEYNVRHIIDLARFLLKTRFLPSHWRSSLFDPNHSQTSKDICSSIIADAFMSIRFPILPLIRETENNKLEMIPRNVKLFVPSDFDYSPYFDIIKYPIFNLSRMAPYQNLPWNEDFISNDDIGTTETPHNDQTQPKSEE